jgi:hypothetical protein
VEFRDDEGENEDIIKLRRGWIGFFKGLSLRKVERKMINIERV